LACQDFAMPPNDNPVTLARLTAFADLEEESLIAVIETRVARAVMRRVDRRLERRMRIVKQPAAERAMVEARRQIAEQLAHLDQVLLTETENWRFLSSEREKMLEEASLWRPITRPSGLKRFFPSRTATTTGSSST
jgi:hypothetical protein